MGIIDESELYTDGKIYTFNNPYNPYTEDSETQTDIYVEKYYDIIIRLVHMLEEVNLQISNESSIMYIDLAWQAVCKYLSCDYDDSQMLQRCGFAVAQLAFIYYSNDKVNREKLAGETPITQTSVGSQSVTFGSKKVELDNFGLTPDIRAVLPARKLRAY